MRSQIVALNLFQGPSFLPHLGFREWMLKQVQHDGADHA